MNEPLGGTLIDRSCPQDRVAERLAYAKTLPTLSANSNLILDTEKIANGTFSPLTGFMGEADMKAVLANMYTSKGVPWTIPIVFHASEKEAAAVSVGKDAAIINSADGSISAIISVSEIFEYDRDNFAQQVFTTTDGEHPGVGQLLLWGPKLIAGDIELLQRSASLIPGGYDYSPREVRAAIAKKGWKRIVGFQTRNLGHRAHEQLQKTALEQVDGLLIHPLIGWKKKGDMQPEVILEGYEKLIEHYYVKKNVMLAALTTAMRYAGPREAIFHAIIRKNFGCTHFIIGRDHAGVGSYYEKYAGHKIVDHFASDLGIEIMRLHGPCWCNTCEAIVTEHTCPHSEDWEQISGTQVRAMLAEGISPPPSFMRPEIAKFLVQRAQEGRVFFQG
ncbi:MAG: sulfate adenylyltransferase [Planctomycetota bacterium]